MQSPERKRKSSPGRPSVPSAENAGKGAGQFGVREGDFHRNRSPGRRCRRRRPSTAPACRHWSSCRGYGARKVGWMFGGIQRPETARPERYAVACLAAAGPIKAAMRPRACVGVGAAIARPQRRRPGSGSAPSGDGSGRLEKLPSFAPVAEPMFHQRRCGAHPDGAGEHQDSAPEGSRCSMLSLSQSSKNLNAAAAAPLQPAALAPLVSAKSPRAAHTATPARPRSGSACPCTA